MPTPQVSVSQPQPQVEVNQAQPTVQVQQAQPQVQVQPGEAGQVQVEQGQAVVRQEQPAGSPQVNLQRGEPRVTFEPAEPNIQVQSQGEPQINFTQSGEPQIRFEDIPQGDPAQAPQGGQAPQPAQQGAAQQPGQQPGQQGAAPQPGQQQPAQAQPGQAQPTDLEAYSSLRVTNQQLQAGQPSPYLARDVIGQRVVNAEGTLLGVVDRVVASNDRTFIIVRADQALRLPAENLALPLENVTYNGQELLMRGLTDEEIQNVVRFDVNAAQDVPGEQQVQIGTM
jgi:hypothetical protein